MYKEKEVFPAAMLYLALLLQKYTMTRESDDAIMKYQPKLKGWLLNRDWCRHPAYTYSSPSYHLCNFSLSSSSVAKDVQEDMRIFWDTIKWTK